MSYKNGIQICTSVIVKLVSGNNLEKRIEEAYVELSGIGIMDTSIEYFKEITEWCEKYHLNKEFDIKLDGIKMAISNETNGEGELSNLATTLAKLCATIIEHNAISS